MKIRALAFGFSLLLLAPWTLGQPGAEGDYVVAGSFHERWRADRWREQVSDALARDFAVYRAYPFGTDEVFYRVLYGPVGYVEETPLIEELDRLGARGAWVLRDAVLTERIERVEPQPAPAAAPPRRVSAPRPLALPAEAEAEEEEAEETEEAAPPAPRQDSDYNLARLKRRSPSPAN